MQINGIFKFLYIDPLKQGLKLKYGSMFIAIVIVFIHRSIKTRIETSLKFAFLRGQIWFLYIDPLKQGLKQQDGILLP